MAETIPSDALAHHLAILGKTGAGKSNAAKVVVEAAMDAGERVCVIDPTGAWYGLRLRPDGKPSPYPVAIFGGLHADVPIGAAHGAAIAEVVATSSTPAIIDTRLMTVGERTAFFTAFAQTLLRKNQGALRLVIDEAHVFAPQGRVADPRSGEMLHAANNLVSLGRSIGLRIIMLSQRPAKLHKDSLTQIETLVAMRVIAPQDVAAVQDWIGEWAGKEQGREIVASLPSLPTGDAWIWSPEIGFLERRHFPLAKTYDSGRPQGVDGAQPVLQDIDLSALKDKLASVEAETKANDPKALKAEIARLKGELAKKPATVTAAPDPAALADAEERGYAKGYEAGRRAGAKDIIITASAESREMFSRLLADAEQEAPERPQEPPRPRAAVVARPRPAPAVAAQPARAEKANGEDISLTVPMRRVLNALAWWRAFGIEQPTSEQVAFIAGYSASSSGYANLKGAMRSAGLIDYPQPGRVRLAGSGAAHAEEPSGPTTREAFHVAVRTKLSNPQRRLLDPLIDAFPEALDTDTLALAADYSPSSSGFANLRGQMRTLGFLDYPAPGQTRAADWLFP